ncbi:hypothetical protein Plo01_41260 [Planobispora longispora]|uniref:Uncharacterized protein n=1 Tax=Planobispora longispora TaxID=28887 RepID=A0A8J3RPT6_9ACTN|nr:hypothetical protein Plo01_41260 [Planobispora longispora]
MPARMTPDATPAERGAEHHRTPFRRNGTARRRVHGGGEGTAPWQGDAASYRAVSGRADGIRWGA